jgi:hypothetical protein
MRWFERQTGIEEKKGRMNLETIISVGVFGWLAIGMVLMGLGIW